MLLRRASCRHSCEMADQPPPPRRPGAAPLYLLVENVRKEHNMGALLRSACAFGAKAVLLCGAHGVKSFASANGAGRVRVLQFPEGVAAGTAWLRETAGTSFFVCGVEITATSESIFAAPWRGPTALLLGCERSGLSSAALACCDHVVHIPQFGGLVASLNVAAAAAVAMSWYVSWASSTFEEGLGIPLSARVEGLDGGQGRFVVTVDKGDEDENGHSHDAAAELDQLRHTQMALREARAARRLTPEASDEECLLDIFGTVEDDGRLGSHATMQ